MALTAKYEAHEKHTIICETIILFSCNQTASLTLLLDSSNFEIRTFTAGLFSFRSINGFLFLSFLRRNLASHNSCYADLIWSSVIGDSFFLLRFIQFIFVHFSFGLLLLLDLIWFLFWESSISSTTSMLSFIVYCLPMTTNSKKNVNQFLNRLFYYYYLLIY